MSLHIDWEKFVKKCKAAPAMDGLRSVHLGNFGFLSQETLDRLEDEAVDAGGMLEYSMNRNGVSLFYVEEA